MKTSKQFLSVFLALIMVISIIPMSSITASAVSGSDYTSVSALATKLTQVFNGDIDIYSNSSCTTEVSMPINTNMNNSTTYYVKSNTTGNKCSGKQCYIYANAVYNKLYNEWVGNGGSFAHSVNVITKGKSSLSYSDFVNAGVKCGAYLRTTTNSDGTFSGNYGHSMIILSYNSSNITYLEGNGDGNGAIRITTKTWSNFNSSQLTGKSRYVSHLVQPTESYYNSIYPSKYNIYYNYNYTENGIGYDIMCIDETTGVYTINCSPTRTGYTLLGWSKSSTATSPTYYNGQTYTFTTDTTLYAVWKANTYTVSYNANGGTGAPASQTKTHGTTLTLSNTIPTKTGYTFLGWSTSSTATTATYSAGGSFTTNANTTLYAVWKANTYTVSYNANGGSGAPASQTGSTNYTISSTVPTRFGYTFLGWSISSTATTATYQPGDNFTANANTTLYAVWKSATVLSVNTQCSADISFPNQEVYYVFTPSLTDEYTFESIGSLDTRVYVYDATGTSIGYNDDGGEGTNFKLSCDLTAGTTYYVMIRLYKYYTGTIEFKVMRTCTITYDGNGGTNASGWKDWHYGEYGTTTIDNTIPIRTGYTFLGWSTSKTATIPTYQPGDSITVDSDITLYAVWQKDPVTPDMDFTFSIQEPSRTTIRNKDGIVLHANVEGTAPTGSYVEWTWNNSKFDVEKNDDGTLTIVSENNGKTTFTATLYSEDGEVLATDSIEMTSKAGFFDKIGGFFRSLFGTTKIYEN